MSHHAELAVWYIKSYIKPLQWGTVVEKRVVKDEVKTVIRNSNSFQGLQAPATVPG